MLIRRGLFCILVLALAYFSVPVYASSKNTNHYLGSYPQPLSKAAVLMDAASGRVLYAKNSDVHLPPASLTKIMTGLLVVENGNLEQATTISESSAQTPESTIYLTAGEVLTRRQLLYACLLNSANDAATALAESVGGDENKFVKSMNRRAHELGMKSTHFNNPHGLNTSQHYTSAYDLALLTRQAMSNPGFRKVVATKKTSIPWLGHKNDRAIINRNRLLYRYQGAIGVKTGYTKEAGNCVVGAAKRGDLVLIAVAMNSPRVYEDLIQMLDYGFAHYQLTKIKKSTEVSVAVNVLWGETSTLKANLSDDLAIALTPAEKAQVTYRVFPKKQVFAPVRRGQILGVCKTYINGCEISQGDLVASSNVSKKASPRGRTSSGAIWIVGLGAAIFSLYMFLRPRLK
ncbi:MAG: D-alanyl-D-alanine carboxypeptidase family protein [Methylocystaceae bacterium]